MGDEQRPFLIENGNTPVLVDRDDRVWSIFDCYVNDGRLVIVQTGSTRAHHRVFECPTGQKRIYTFTADDRRDADVNVLEQQCRDARPLLKFP